eukprot:TRINITY_DN12636_c0_g1::TRINITY_DN12636_c0_g1_i1::g.13536::m.13536 TRINITY_DN12636_c0_g1::TRINITY_DN12636_c0_g1_i1::g.13536  ORF type:complete len:238 (+),score=40.11,GRAM/PF02893.15/2.6e-05 TRINITY_DN12636_c0_g1_i1:128-841(+)
MVSTQPPVNPACASATAPQGVPYAYPAQAYPQQAYPAQPANTMYYTQPAQPTQSSMISSTLNSLTSKASSMINNAVATAQTQGINGLISNVSGKLDTTLNIVTSGGAQGHFDHMFPQLPTKEKVQTYFTCIFLNPPVMNAVPGLIYLTERYIAFSSDRPMTLGQLDYLRFLIPLPQSSAVMAALLEAGEQRPGIQVTLCSNPPVPYYFGHFADVNEVLVALNEHISKVHSNATNPKQ